jgi:uncharacterized protein (TIGR00255 family)
MQSMTGYGQAAAKVRKSSVNVQVRSVNHRFFTCQLNLPEILSDKSGDIEAMVRKYIPRGSINLSIKLELGSQKEVPGFNIPLIKSYYHQLKLIQKTLKLKEDISINTLLHLVPLQPAEQNSTMFLASDWAAIERVIVKALNNLLKMRKREAGRLKIQLEQMTKKMQTINNNIQKRMPQVVANHQEVFSRRIKEMLLKQNLNITEQNGNIDANNLTQRIAEEIALFAQRIDIAEEIQRFDSHLNEFLHIMNQSGLVGKKLDFLTQEMLREVNTIASKANDTEIAYYTINLKSDIEKIKEQVQNIE